MAYYQLEPFGAERGDLQAGIIAAQLYNIHRSKGAKASKPSDYVLEFERPKPQTANEMIAIFKRLGQRNG